jgi:hypothetical protein
VSKSRGFRNLQAKTTVARCSFELVLRADRASLLRKISSKYIAMDDRWHFVAGGRLHCYHIPDREVFVLAAIFSRFFDAVLLCA